MLLVQNSSILLSLHICVRSPVQQDIKNMLGSVISMGQLMLKVGLETKSLIPILHYSHFIHCGATVK